MENLKNFFTKWQSLILVVLFCFIYLGQCSNNRTVSKQRTEIKELTAKVDSLSKVVDYRKPLTKKEVKDEMEEVMFNYIVFEDDLDKGKTTLSQIKNEISK